MFEDFTLEELDRDGAIREMADTAVTRGGLLKRAGAGAAALTVGGVFAGALPAIARGETIPAADIAILNFALTLEYLEAAFYAEAVANKKLTDKRTLRFASVVAQHEHSHVLYLKKVLGSRAVASPTFDFKGTTSDQAKFQVTADALENAGVHAYLGQVPRIKSTTVKIGAGRILPVEARHAAWIRDIRFGGGTTSATTPAPSPFEEGFTKAQVLAALKTTGFIVG